MNVYTNGQHFFFLHGCSWLFFYLIVCGLLALWRPVKLLILLSVVPSNKKIKKGKIDVFESFVLILQCEAFVAIVLSDEPRQNLGRELVNRK